VSGIELDEDICNFIREFGGDLSSLELLLFFSRHPNTRFNRTAVMQALVTRQFDTGIILQRLIKKKMVVTCDDNGVTLYGLTKEEPAHSLAARLVNIGQLQWQVILEQILDAQGIV
jgi:hypothetical protein